MEPRTAQGVRLTQAPRAPGKAGERVDPQRVGLDGCTWKAKPPFRSPLIQLIQGCVPVQGAVSEAPIS